jgi:hypothetical protein
MALIIQKQQASLIGAGSLPTARATSAVPDFSSAKRLGNQLMTQGDEEDRRKKAQDDLLAGQAAGGEFVAIDENGNYKPMQLPDGSPEFRAGYLDAANSNRDASFERGLADQFNTIMSDPDATPEQKAARLKAAAEGVIERAPPDRKGRYAEWVNGQLTQRLTGIATQETARQEQLRVEGLTTTIKADVDTATSAAAAGLPQDDVVKRIDQNYDTLVKLGRMSPEAAAQGKAAARQVITGQALVNRLVTGLAKGEVGIDEVDAFGTGLETNNSTAEVIVQKTYRVGPGAQSTVATGYRAKDVFGKITDEGIRKDMGLKLRQAATDYRQRAAAKAKGDELVEQLNFQATPRGQNTVLPSAMHDDFDGAIGRMMAATDPLNNPAGEAALLEAVSRARYMPKPVISTLEMMMNSGNPDDIGKAVVMWRKLTTLETQSGGNAGQMIRNDVPEATRNRFDVYADAFELGYPLADIQNNEKEARGSRNFGLDQLILDYNRGLNDDSRSFEKDFMARWARDYKGANPDPAAADSFARAYRQSMIVLRDPAKAFDDAYARMKEIHKQSDIFVSGMAKGRADLTNPYGFENATSPYSFLEDQIRADLAGALGAGSLMIPEGVTVEQINDLLQDNPNQSAAGAAVDWLRGTPDFLGRTVKLQPVEGSNPDAPEYMVRMFDLQGNDMGYVRRKDGTAFTVNPHVERQQFAAKKIYGDKRKALEEAAEQAKDRLLLDTIEKGNIDTFSDKANQPMSVEQFLSETDPELEKEYRLQKMEIEDGLKKSLERLEKEGGIEVSPSKIGPQTLMQPKASGFDVAAAAASQIDSVLPDGTGGTFMLRVAAQESAFGTANGTYRMIGDKGMMQTNTRSSVIEVKRQIASGKGRAFAANEKLKAQLGIDLAKVTDDDLDKPLVSMAMARVYAEVVGTPIPQDVEGQAAWWKRHYNTYAGAGTPDQFIRNASKVPDGWDTPRDAPPSSIKGNGRVAISYVNQGAKRSLPVTPSLEAKLQTAVASEFGDGYTVQIFSGGQGEGSNGTTGTRRHNDEGNGGRAADVYVVDPNGKRVTDPSRLLRLRRFWLAQGYGSVGHFMKGHGMHFDEITKDQLRRGEALSWRY